MTFVGSSRAHKCPRNRVFSGIVLVPLRSGTLVLVPWLVAICLPGTSVARVGAALGFSLALRILVVGRLLSANGCWWRRGAGRMVLVAVAAQERPQVLTRSALRPRPQVLAVAAVVPVMEVLALAALVALRQRPQVLPNLPTASLR